MGNESLSQEEINALLADDDQNESNQSDSKNKELLTEMQKDAVGEVANISMGSAATALYGLLGQKVEITTPRVELTTAEEVVNSYQRPCIVVDVQYVEGLKGNNQLILEQEDAAVITDLMMGGDGTEPPEEFSELQLSAVGEAMNQMMGSASTSMSDFFEGDKVNISPPKAELLEMSADIFNLEGIDNDDEIVQVIFDMHIADLIDSQIVQVMTIDFAVGLAEGLLNQSTEGQENLADDASIQTEEPMQQQPMQQQPMQQQPMQQQPMQQQSMQQDVEVQDVEFNQLSSGQSNNLSSDINLIYDVPLELTVRLGKTRMKIKEILELAPGSVIELDRLAGEAVDLLVNGKLIAKGEVVVMDENFGFRVTDIVSSQERLQKL